MDLPVASPSACIQQAAHYEPTAIERMSVGQGGGLVRVPLQFLYRADVVAALEQMGGEAVAQRVAQETQETGSESEKSVEKRRQICLCTKETGSERKCL